MYLHQFAQAYVPDANIICIQLQSAIASLRVLFVKHQLSAS